MEFRPTAIAGVLLLVPKVHEDERGFFMETYNRRAFASAGLDVTFVQDNHSRSQQGTLRGLHYQIDHPQGKLVRAIAGEVYDVAVDMRARSPTLGHWAGAYLSAENRHQLWVPPGFAHGFYVCSERADVVYKCTDYYYPQHERCLRWDDPDVGIAWPLVSGAPLLLSARDRQGLALRLAERHP